MAIELKAPGRKGSLSTDQALYLESVGANGGIWMIANEMLSLYRPRRVQKASLLQLVSVSKLSALGQAALEYAEKNWYVFPCVPGDKRPLIRDNFKLSSVEPSQITMWWTEYPFANIGLDCGKSGLVAIDVDPGKEDAKALPGIIWLSGGRKAWHTRRHATPSGGEHYIFQAAPESEGEIPTSTGIFGGPGIDGRGKGGYVVLPPSRLLSGAYSVADSSAPLPVPRGILHPVRSVRDLAGRTELQALLQDGERIAVGGRDNFLYRVACALRRIGLDALEIIPALQAAYYRRCTVDSSLDESDIVRIVESACNHLPSDPVLARAMIDAEQDGDYDALDEATATNLTAFVAKNIEPITWLAEGIFQTNSLNMLMGPPKSAKSTLARRLALDVALGISFLGRFGTRQTPVLYYTLQENKQHLHEWYSAAISQYDILPEAIPIDLIFRIGKRGQGALDGLRSRIRRNHYGLIIIDMFGRFAGLRSMDDYAEVENYLDRLKAVVDETGACVIWLHHERKAGGLFEGGIGSQAIRGAVYTTLKTYKKAGVYYIASEQRTGDDLPDTSVLLDKKTQVMRTGGGVLVNEIASADLESRVAKVLSAQPEATARQVRNLVGGNNARVLEIIKKLRKK